jgi:HlyD family secretion protein
MADPFLLIPILAATTNEKGGKRFGMLLFLLLAAGGAAYYMTRPGPSVLTLTGIVTTNDVVVSSQISGRIATLAVKEGDNVTKDQLVATIDPQALEADRAYYAHSVEGMSSQVSSNEAALRYQEEQTEHQVQQAQASLAAILAQQDQAKANLENTKLNFDRANELVHQEIAPTEQLDQTRTAYDAARAQVDSFAKQADAQRAAVALAQSNAQQVAMRQAQLQQTEHQKAAMQAQQEKANVELGYTKIVAPVGGIVDVRASLEGEVVNPGQPIITLINSDDLWVRADVEETYIGRIKLGDHLTVRLPSGEERQGTVFFRGIDGGFATQRDVSRVKRDIKTFEVRLRVDNKDRALAVGMTVYVLLPVAPR